MEAHQLLLPLVHQSPMAMAKVNAQGIIHRVNPKAIQLRSVVTINQQLYIIRLELKKKLIKWHCSLTIEKIEPKSLLIFFQDVTDFLIKAHALRLRL